MPPTPRLTTPPVAYPIYQTGGTCRHGPRGHCPDYYCGRYGRAADARVAAEKTGAGSHATNPITTT